MKIEETRLFPVATSKNNPESSYGPENDECSRMAPLYAREGTGNDSRVASVVRENQNTFADAITEVAARPTIGNTTTTPTSSVETMRNCVEEHALLPTDRNPITSRAQRRPRPTIPVLASPLGCLVSSHIGGLRDDPFRMFPIEATPSVYKAFDYCMEIFDTENSCADTSRRSSLRSFRGSIIHVTSTRNVSPSLLVILPTFAA